jgi:transposase InsO family protein
MRRRGVHILRGVAADFVRKQLASQVFHPPPRSTGKVTAAQPNSLWQADLMDFTTRDVALNQGFRFALVIVDVFTRRVSARPMQDKTARATIQAFEAIRGNGPRAPVPAVFDTDTGGEFDGPFNQQLHRLGVIHCKKTPGIRMALQWSTLLLQG